MHVKSYTIWYWLPRRGSLAVNYSFATRAEAERRIAALGEPTAFVYEDTYNPPNARLDEQGHVRFL